MEKKIIYKVECRLSGDGKSAVAYFFDKDYAQDSLVSFRRKYGYDAVVSVQEFVVEEDVVDFSERL